MTAEKYDVEGGRSPGIKFPPDLYNRYNSLIDYGSKNRAVCLVVELLLDLVEEHGELALGALARGAIRFEVDWFKLQSQRAEKSKDAPTIGSNDERKKA